MVDVGVEDQICHNSTNLKPETDFFKFKIQVKELCEILFINILMLLYLEQIIENTFFSKQLQ